MKEALSTKANYNVARRATEGIQRIHDLLCEGKSNELASFVEDWTLKEFSVTSLSRVVWYVFIIVVRVLMNIADYMPEQVLQSPFYRRFVGICGELWSDYGHRLVSWNLINSDKQLATCSHKLHVVLFIKLNLIHILMWWWQGVRIHRRISGHNHRHQWRYLGRLSIRPLLRLSKTGRNVIYIIKQMLPLIKSLVQGQHWSNNPGTSW